MYTQDNLEPEKLNTAIDEILEQMSGMDCGAEEYATLMDQLTKLYKVKEIDINLKLKTIDTFCKRDDSVLSLRLKEQESDAKVEEMDASRKLKNVDADAKRHEIDKPDRVSKDTLAIIGANLAGIAIIIGYERLNVITSKAIGFVSKLR